MPISSAESKGRSRGIARRFAQLQIQPMHQEHGRGERRGLAALRRTSISSGVVA
jgi:transposase